MWKVIYGKVSPESVRLDSEHDSIDTAKVRATQIVRADHRMTVMLFNRKEENSLTIQWDNANKEVVCGQLAEPLKKPQQVWLSRLILQVFTP